MHAVLAGFRVVRQFGAAGGGEVYLAENLDLDRTGAFDSLALHHGAESRPGRDSSATHPAGDRGYLDAAAVLATVAAVIAAMAAA